MFRIGEFSKLTQVSIRMLRYYDEVALLKPAQIDKYTGYRLYSIEQISVLQRIILLRDMGFSVADIAQTMKDWSKSSVINQLLLKQEDLKAVIAIQEERISKISIAIQDIEKDNLSVHYNIAIKSIPSYHIVSLRQKIRDYFSEGDLWTEFFADIKAQKITLPQHLKGLTIFHDTDYKDSDIDVEVAVVIAKRIKSFNKIKYRELEAVNTVASIMVTGPYEHIGTAYQSFAFWLEEHKQYKIVGVSRQICHRGAFDGVIPYEYLTEIQIPINKAF